MILRLLLLLTLSGVPVPRGTRGSASPVVSSKSYRDTVDFYGRWLDRSGVAHHVVGPYRARGVDVTRFLSDDPSTPWLAIHVYRQSAKVWISVVSRPP